MSVISMGITPVNTPVSVISFRRRLTGKKLINTREVFAVRITAKGGWRAERFLVNFTIESQVEKIRLTTDH